jgi:uncharacterized protein (TIGR02678 family)
VARPALDEHLSAERSSALREMLATPLLHADANRDAFRLVVRHAQWLTDYFETTCGWSLTVDSAAGFARLAKRAASLDATRPLRRTRRDEAPFDRRRYQLLCLVCAELVGHPVTTVGLLATAITGEAELDTSRPGERSAFVDALNVLVSWGVLRVSAGDVDAYVESAAANAILAADTARLHRLLVSAVAPSALGEAPGASDRGVVELLSAEPRYGDVADSAPAEAGDAARNRWARHRLGRRLLDDPVLYIDDLAPAESDYLASLSGRRWLRERGAEAGFEVEERAEGLLAVDAEAVATDARFPMAQGNAYQLALLLADRLVPMEPDGRRRLGQLGPQGLRAEVDAILARFATWARGRRDGDGPRRLAEEAVALLLAFGLARRDAEGTVFALPALARYRVTDPVVTGEPTLFEEQA